jgi:hypothetical protein
MQFEWTISLGQVLMIVSVLGGVLHLHHQFVTMANQHGMMWRDYSSRHGINGSKATPCAAHTHTHYRVTDLADVKGEGHGI